jgi:hypothetical protein
MVEYNPDYTDRDSYFANKDRATAERDLENATGGPKAREKPKAHDYRSPCWGHAAKLIHTTDGGRTGTLSGHGSGIAPDDFVILAHPRGGIASYKVDKIDYQRDPPDMFFADVTWTPGVFQEVGGEIVQTPKES